MAGNTAAFGAGFSVLSSSIATLSAGADLKGNTAGRLGGGVFLSTGGRLVATGGALVRENVAEQGGGVYASDASVELSSGASVAGNRASDSGGGLRLDRSTLVVRSRVSISGNVAVRRGGGVVLSEASELDCQAGGVVRNVAETAGGLDARSHSRVHFQDCNLSYNNATSEFCGGGDSPCGGGGALATDASVLTFSESRVVGNRAGPSRTTIGVGPRGGLLLFGGSSASVSSSQVTGNEAGSNGGGIACLEASVVALNRSQLSDNRADHRGGALFAGADTSVTLHAWNRAEHNQAGTDGGALFSWSEISLSGGGQTVFRGNRAVSGHGGAFATVAAAVRVARGHSMEASANSAGQDGGAVALIAGASIVVTDEVALNFTGNTASGSGGAIVQDSESCTLMQTRCFLDGVGGSRQAVLFGGNRAGTVGGAVYVACSRLGTACAGLLAEYAGHASSSVFRGNAAAYYGNDISSLPSRLEWQGVVQQSVAPGAQALSLKVVLFDAMRSLVRAPGHTVSYVVCGTAGVCSAASAILPPDLAPLDPMSGSTAVNVSVECRMGTDQAVVRAALADGQSYDVARSVTVECRCNAGQARREIAERGTWVCHQCDSPGQYVLDPNNPTHACQTCPAGAVCSARTVTGKVPGSVWEADSQTGRYTLTSCPAGYEMVVASHDAQTCSMCQAGWFCSGGADPAVRCPEGSHSAPGAETPSSCTEAVFVVLTMALPLSKQEFDAPGKQEQYKAALADAANTDVTMVMIQSYEQTSRRRAGGGGPAGPAAFASARALSSTAGRAGRARRGHDGGESSISVASRVAAADDSAARALSAQLSVEAINANLVKRGIPGGELITPPTVEDLTPSEGLTLLAVVLLVCLTLLLAGGLVTLYLVSKWRNSTSRRLMGRVEAGAAADQRDLPPELRRKYCALSVMGSGGTGVVLHASQITRRHGLGAKHEAVTAWRALKIVHATGPVFSDSELRPLEREAALLGRIHCPNVVHFHEAGMSADRAVFWISMEKLDGHTLREVLQINGPMEQVEAIKVGLDVCAGLKAIHELEVIHRDLKPGNVMRSPDGKCKIIDLGTARAVDQSLVRDMYSAGCASSTRTSMPDRNLTDSLKTLSAGHIHFAGTPAYASPENFIQGAPLTFASDIWSLSIMLFELVTGSPPFPNVRDAVAAGAVIAGDMDAPVPDVRDIAPEIRSGLSSMFAKALAEGLENALYSCLVDTGEESYSTFICYRVFSQKFHAMLLHEVLNNTITPGGHRVINYLDVKRLVPGEDWEIGFSRGLLNSLVALPLVSSGMLEPMKKMKGTAEDRADNVCKELQIMHALMASWRQARLSLNTSLRGVHSNLREVFPILIGAPGEDSAKEGDSRNIWSGNFFEDGSSDPILAGELVEKVSPATTNAVVAFLESNGVPLSRASKQRTVASTVSHLLALDCAKLWEHEALEPEEIPEDGELWNSVQRAPPSPALSLDQLRALKAELRALVPAIHEVVDRAHQDAKRAPSLRSIASRMSGVREVTRGSIAAGQIAERSELICAQQDHVRAG
ncbi:hypothetical protein T484DRAFT_1784367 [Baffinella frigidus]|nr:hypothetical protein T484DRAFT_1784367 [Cryptophyta sp. CCMP2293]